MYVFDKIVDNMQHIEFNLTKNCNFACKYCFVDASTKYEMTTEQIDFLMEKYTKKDKNDYSICFFGGEPLLKFDLIKHTMDNYGHKVNDFSVITNGSLLTQDMIDYFNSLKQKKYIQISSDGPEFIHNEYRVDCNNKGTFEKTYNSIKLLKKNNFQMWGIHSTCSSFHIKYFFDIYTFLLNNLPDNQLTSLFNNIQIIHDCKEYNHETLDYWKENIIKILKTYPQADKCLLETTYNKNEHIFCSAGFNYFSFFADGTIAPCHRISEENKEKTVIGNFITGNWNENIFQIFHNHNQNLKCFHGIEKCNNCKSSLCYPCYSANYNNTGDFFTAPISYCWFKKETDKFIRQQLNIGV